MLYIFWFLHQPTTWFPESLYGVCCISFDSYIKPQPLRHSTDNDAVVYLLIPTSNHNLANCCLFLLLVVYLLIPTSNHNSWAMRCSVRQVVYLLIPTSKHTCRLRRPLWFGCISFDSYIKPQLSAAPSALVQVVYLLIPTSNHNQHHQRQHQRTLYIFWFLHQTTTFILVGIASVGCISFDSYIKPQLFTNDVVAQRSCISFDSYIKPQHSYDTDKIFEVVYLLIPTSNHNFIGMLLLLQKLYIFWFLHQTTTYRI